MILLLFLLVVLVAAAGAGLLGVGVLSDDRRRERSGLLAALSAPVILVAGLAVLGVLVVGLGGGEPEGGDGPAAGPTTTAPPPRQALPSARVETIPSDVPVVRIQAADEDRFSTNDPVGGLVPGSVVRVLAEGFDWSERGRVEQCVTELGRLTACAGAFPVQFDDRGRADFQFAVRGDVAQGGCRVGQSTCLIRLTGDASRRHGTVQTVLVDRLVPGRVRVEPGRAVADGQRVEVSVTGFPAGTTATAVLCAPPETYDARRCSPPDPSSTFTVDAGGTGHTTLPVAAGRLGPDAARCGPRRPCGVSVVVGSGFIAAPVAPVAFSLGPGVEYRGGRLVAGLLVAAALGAVAVGLAASTDWTKPTEAATPKLDRADLRADRSLDQLFGTEQELDERDPIRW